MSVCGCLNGTLLRQTHLLPATHCRWIRTLTSLCWRKSFPDDSMRMNDFSSQAKLQQNHRVMDTHFQKEYIPAIVQSMRYSNAPEAFDVTLFSDAPSLLEAISDQAGRSSITAADAALCLQTLHHLAYDNLNALPWLHTHNRSLAYMQLLMNDILGSEMASILDHPGFTHLLETVEANLAIMDSEDLTISLLSCLWLGIEKHNPTVQKIFMEMHERVDSMTVNQLLTLSDCLRALRRTDIILAGKVSRRFVELMALTEAEHLNEPNFTLITRLGTNIWGILSPSSISELATKTGGWLDSVNNISDLSVLSSYCRLIKRLQTSKTKGVNVSIEKLEMLIENCHGRMLPYHIAEIAHSLKTTSLYTTKMADCLQSRTFELLNSGNLTKIGEITNACYSLNRSISDMDRRQVEDILYRKMHDADVLVLSNIADILVDIDCKNQDVIHLFISMVMKHLHKVLMFVTRLSKILRFLNQKQCRKVSDTEELFSAVYHQLYQQQGIHIWSISNLSSFLLRHISNVIPGRLYERLMVAIPQCDLLELQAIMVGLSKIRRPRIRTLQNQVQTLQSLIQANIAQQVGDINSLDMLHQMIVSLCLRWELRDTGLLNALMDQYPKFTKDLTQRGFIKTLNIVNQLRYFSPRIMDDLGQFAIENHNNLGLDRFSYFVRTLANIGYVPHNADTFMQICVQLYEDSGDILDLSAKLSFALNLCKLQMFPESILNSVFTVEFIEEVDKYIDDHRESRDEIEKTFMELNRCMVLECPSLDIPWFHEQYCLDTLPLSLDHAGQNWRGAQFRSEVELVLQEVLGGRKYFGTMCSTPDYHYPLDFECILNPQGTVVPYTMSNIDNCQQLGFQRVAILTLVHSRYCCNEKRLIGSEQLKKRHLEIMGYKVIEVPVFEWKSMALTEHPAREDYLRQKIFAH